MKNTQINGKIFDTNGLEQLIYFQCPYYRSLPCHDEGTCIIQWSYEPYTKELMFFNCSVEETLESPLDNKEIKPINPKEN